MTGAKNGDALALVELTSAKATLDEVAFKFGAMCAAIPEEMSATEANKRYDFALEVGLKHAAMEVYRAYNKAHGKGR